MKITDIATLPIGKNPHHVDARVAYDTEHAVAEAVRQASSLASVAGKGT